MKEKRLKGEALSSFSFQPLSALPPDESGQLKVYFPQDYRGKGRVMGLSFGTVIFGMAPFGINILGMTKFGID